MQRPVRFGAATTNVERGAGMGSARTIGQLPHERFSQIFPPDPTSEIGKIRKHYDYPRLADAVIPMLQWGYCWSLKSSELWIFQKIFSVFDSPIITAGVFLRHPPGFIHFRSRDHRNGVAQITVVWKFQQNLPRNLGKFQKK